MLYLSCETEALAGAKGQASLRRLIRQDFIVANVVFVTSEKGGVQPEIFHPYGDENLALHLQSEMMTCGFDVTVNSSQDHNLTLLAESVMQLLPEEVIELRLSTGMAREYYRDIGHCLEALRDQGLLLICLSRSEKDYENATPHQPHDSYIRNLVRQWEEEQQWVKAMSKSGVSDKGLSIGNSNQVADPTLCVLNTAFSLGGMRAPQRLFGFSMNENSHALRGYGWMQ